VVPPTRLLAWRLLDDILFRDTRLELALARARPSAQREQALLVELVRGVLRCRVALDWALTPLVRRLDPRTQNLLRLGAYQILFLDRTPVHAAVDLTVECVAETRERRFVNAVLRSLASRRDELRTVLEAHPDPLVRHNLPAELYADLCDWLPPLQLASYLERIASPPPVYLRVNTARATTAEVKVQLRAEGVSTEEDTSLPGCLRLCSPLAGYLHCRVHQVGLATVLGLGSQLVTALCEPLPPDRILDLCAGKGGKSLALWLLAPRGCHLTAVERDRRQVVRMKENLDRLQVQAIEVLQADLLDLHIREEYELVLLDAPCSALAELDKYPDLRWRYRRKDLAGLGSAQLALLRVAASAVAPGGRLVYSVCTFTPRETVENLAAFEREAHDFRLVMQSGVVAAPDGPGLLQRLTSTGFFWACYRRGNGV